MFRVIRKSLFGETNKIICYSAGIFCYLFACSRRGEDPWGHDTQRTHTETCRRIPSAVGRLVRELKKQRRHSNWDQRVESAMLVARFP